jgi:hypothetical protein
MVKIQSMVPTLNQFNTSKLFTGYSHKILFYHHPFNCIVISHYNDIGPHAYYGLSKINMTELNAILKLATESR